MKKTRTILSITVFTFIAFIAIGCGRGASATDENAAESTKPDVHEGHEGHGDHEGHDHAAGDEGSAKPPADVKNGFDGMPAPGTKALCPIMKNEFEVSGNSEYSEYKGKTYVFCCPGCKPTFDADPEKYIKAL